jgi:hypothetical protein
LKNREKELVNESLLQDLMCMNLQTGGGGGLSGKKHSQKTKDSISKKNSINQKGERNSQFGTVWISKDGNSLKVKAENLDFYLSEGWIK